MYVAIIESCGGPPFPPIHSDEGSELCITNYYTLLMEEAEGTRG